MRGRNKAKNLEGPVGSGCAMSLLATTPGMIVLADQLQEDENIAQMMIFLWRLRGKTAPKAVAKSLFSDVAKNHEFYNAIFWGAQKKVTTG